MRKRVCSIVWILIMSAMLNACATVPLASPELDKKAKSMTPPPDKALLYIYGINHFKIDDDYEADLETREAFKRSYRAFLLEPGRHKIKGDLGDRPQDTLALNAKAGRTYYITYDKWAWKVPLIVVPADEGKKNIESRFLALHIAGDDDPIPVIRALDGAQPSVQAATAAPAATVSQNKVVRSDIDDLPAPNGKPNGKMFGIVIGIEQYRQKLPVADYATQDAKLVADYLTKSLGYPEANVITLTNDRATNVDLVKYFEKWLPNNVEPGSTVFVYYSGHGAPDPKSGSAYLVPYDGDPAFIDETGYSLKRMYAALGKLPAKEIIVALDSCFSGAGGRSVIAKGSRPLVMNMQKTAVPRNMTVLSASAGDQTSSTYDEKGHGLFTYFLLKGIKNEDVVRQDGSLKIDDLFSYMKPQVERIARKQYNNEQTPQLIGAKTN